MSPKLYIPIGIPGSGKSTWCREHLYATPVSTDDIRARMGDVNDQSHNDEVFERYHYEIGELLADLRGINVVADATNLTRKARSTLYEIARANKADVHIILFKNLSEAVSRNNLRERTVPPEAMVRMLDNYEQTVRLLPVERSHYVTITEISSLG